MEEAAQCSQRQCYRVAELFIPLPKTPFRDGAHLATREKELMLLTVPDLQITFFCLIIEPCESLMQNAWAHLVLLHYTWLIIYGWTLSSLTSITTHIIIYWLNPCHSQQQLPWRWIQMTVPVSAQVLHEVPQALQKEIDNYQMWQLLGCRVVERRLEHPHFCLFFLFNCFVT